MHCRPGNGGCGIYAERPASCRGFVCDWLVNPHLGDEWYPGRAKMFVHYNYDPLGIMGLYVIVDPARPAGGLPSRLRSAGVRDTERRS